MDEERGFLTALAEAPGDDPTWLAYADWLEERADERALFFRLTTDLARGAVAPFSAKDVVVRLRWLRDRLPTGWLDQCDRALAARPFRFRILHVIRQEGADPWTWLEGVSESGTIRAWDGVAVPLENDTVAHTWVRRSTNQLSAGQAPPDVALLLAGNPPDILCHGALVPSPVADAEMQAKLSLSLAELGPWSPRGRSIMQRLGLTTVRDLASRTPDELLSGRSFGETALRGAREKLATLGLELGMERFLAPR